MSCSNVRNTSLTSTTTFSVTVWSSSAASLMVMTLSPEMPAAEAAGWSTDAIFRGRTGVLAPLTSVLAEILGLRAVGDDCAHVASLTTISPRRANCCRRCAQVHGVADQRVLEPLLGAEQRRGDLAGRQPDAEAERLGSPSARHSSLTAACAACIAAAATSARSAWSLVRDRRAEHGHHRVADVLHHGAARRRGSRRSSRRGAC